MQALLDLIHSFTQTSYCHTAVKLRYHKFTQHSRNSYQEMYGSQCRPFIHPSQSVNHVPVSRPGFSTFSRCACSGCQHPVRGFRPVSSPIQPVYSNPYYSASAARRPRLPVFNYQSFHPAVNPVQHPAVNPLYPTMKEVGHPAVRPVQHPPMQYPAVNPVRYPVVQRPLFYHPDGETHKPVYSYVDLIIMAIRNSPDFKATVEEIYSFIMFNFPYYRFCHPGWKNSIRHNLSVRKSTFAKIPREKNECARGKGGYWTVVVNNEESIAQDKTGKYNYKRKYDGEDSAESLILPLTVQDDSTESLECSEDNSESDDSIDIPSTLNLDRERQGLFAKFSDSEPACKRLRTETVNDNESSNNKLEESFIDITHCEDADSTTRDLDSIESTQNNIYTGKHNLQRLREKMRNIQRLSLFTKE